MVVTGSLLLLCTLYLWAIVSSAVATTVPQKNRQVPQGFVTTSGRNFELNGKPFVSLLRTCCHVTDAIIQAFVGANSYVRATILSISPVCLMSDRDTVAASLDHAGRRG